MWTKLQSRVDTPHSLGGKIGLADATYLVLRPLPDFILRRDVSMPYIRSLQQIDATSSHWPICELLHFFYCWQSIFQPIRQRYYTSSTNQRAITLFHCCLANRELSHFSSLQLIKELLHFFHCLRVPTKTFNHELWYIYMIIPIRIV